ncbi:MAG: hypothetical protein IPM97_16140 [Bdellovibrionaceae bacterium]|nr:hypothetical protein [Pseudobdellovibrionaceae bacterium]
MKKMIAILGLVSMSLTVHATSLNDLKSDYSGQIDTASKDILACIALKRVPNIMVNVEEARQAVLISWFDQNCGGISQGKSLNDIRKEFGQFYSQL